jgi:hypothetical protein
MVTPREAATVMLVRDDPDLQVFMLRRSLNADWVGGAYVFPGGAVDDTHVDVVYSILLDSAAVLDHVQGGAVQDGGKWLVSKDAYCQVASLGQSTVPEPCR